MSPIKSLTQRSPRAPELRLLHGQCDRTRARAARTAPLRGHDTPPPALHLLDRPPRILLAGADSGRRAVLLAELTQTLSASTVFEEAGAVCDVLEQAPASSMAFITGDLDDAPAESLMQMLAHRHPELPVLIVDSPTRRAGGGPVAARRDELRVQYA